MWCQGPHCRSSKRFHTHSREVEAGTVILAHQVGGKVTEKSTDRTDTQASDSGSGMASLGHSSVFMGEGDTLSLAPSPRQLPLNLVLWGEDGLQVL